MADEMVIFTKTYDLLTWLLPKCDQFPKPQRFVVTKRLQDALLNFQESLYDANAEKGPERLFHLRRADAHLNKVRLYLRLAHQWAWLSPGQYQHASKMVAEVGRLLGGWVAQSSGGRHA